MSKRPFVEFSEEQMSLVLGFLQSFEAQYLADGTHGFNNPFRRPGVTAAQLATHCGFETGDVTKSGRMRYDTPKARQLLKLLVARGKVECTGAHRTMSCGSKSTECFALAGFCERLESVKTAWLMRPPAGTGQDT